MDRESGQPTLGDVFALAASQHYVVTRGQLLALGLDDHAIAHRVRSGRLHRVRRGIYAVGRPQLDIQGIWMAAVLSCGPEAVLSHEPAASLWEIRSGLAEAVEVSVPATCHRRPGGVAVHRRARLGAGDVTRRYGVPVTSPVRTLIDIAPRLSRGELEAAINEADKRNLVDPEALRSGLDGYAAQPGVVALREVLDRTTFTLTESELERRFLPLARRAGLPLPQTQRWLNGFRVDFYWPDLGLVVETDGLRYHRTPAEHARDRMRDQAHTAAGLTPLRFTRAQVRFEPRHVEATLTAVASRLRGRR